MAKRKVKTGLTVKQNATLVALLSSPNIEEAAKKSGVSIRSVYNWLDDETFVDEYHSARLKLIDAIVGQLIGVATEAIATLREALTSATAKWSDKVRAAGLLLERFVGAASLHELMKEVEDLKREGVIVSGGHPPADTPLAGNPNGTPPAGGPGQTSTPVDGADGAAADVATVPGEQSESAGSDDQSDANEAGDGKPENPDDGNDLKLFDEE
jgi:hypothetical protein